MNTLSLTTQVDINQFNSGELKDKCRKEPDEPDESAAYLHLFITLPFCRGEWETIARTKIGLENLHECAPPFYTGVAERTP